MKALLFLFLFVWAARSCHAINLVRLEEAPPDLRISHGITQPILITKLTDFSDIVRLSPVSDFYIAQKTFLLSNFEMAPTVKEISKNLGMAQGDMFTIRVNLNKNYIWLNMRQNFPSPSRAIYPWKLYGKLSYEAKVQISDIARRYRGRSVADILRGFEQWKIDGYSFNFDGGK